ncbi:MAG: hypothetical protein F4Y31_11675 [Gammaproteobacteria bacterium]|nr:hypothetical protein [Gammaproteobacteria bacterium]MYF66552.1 hypothetical protein [Gammaproteobacteria bacterium]MYK37136.1 hypothetical protein [Gammaproteobacteria bacterium]
MNPPDAFDRILALLHRATLDEARWPAATALIEEVCGFAGNLLIVGELVGDDVRVDFFRFLRRGEARQDLGRLYFDVYYPRDELPRHVRARPAGQLNHIPELYTELERSTSVAYREGLLRTQAQNGLIARLDWQHGLRVVWSLGDPVGRGGWQSDHVRLIESLLPHVRQFVRVRQALAGADALSAGLAGLLEISDIGVLHLDRDGRVLAANGPALEILRRGQGLSDREGALHASLPADDGRLQRLLKRALPGGANGAPAGGSIRIQRPRLRSRLELHVHPVDSAQADYGGRRAAALVLVVDPENRPPIDPVRVAALLGLTPSEGRVAALLAEGRPVREIAETTGLKESYVRWLLKQIYRKQDISGQIALVQRVLSAQGLPRR